MRVHILKCWPEPFAALKSGAKKHEVRKDDRAFMVGDVLRLDEWEPHKRPTWWSHDLPKPDLFDVFQARDGEVTGERLWLRVTYKSAGGTWGLPPDVCVLSIESCEEPKP